MSYRNERLNNSMRSLEDSAQGIDMSKWRVLSDLGVGVERMVEAIDGEACVGGPTHNGNVSCVGEPRPRGGAKLSWVQFSELHTKAGMNNPRRENNLPI